MKSLIFPSILIVMCVSLLSAIILGFFKQQNLTVLTQDERYIGYELHHSFRFPWQNGSTYKTIDLTPLLHGTGGQVILPDGSFNIFNTIFTGNITEEK